LDYLKYSRSLIVKQIVCKFKIAIAGISFKKPQYLKEDSNPKLEGRSHPD
jgi:hypothetical protein